MPFNITVKPKKYSPDIFLKAKSCDVDGTNFYCPRLKVVAFDGTIHTYNFLEVYKVSSIEVEDHD